MSFSCPHFRPDDEHCLRLKAECVPGRRGCVLGSKTVFATPPEVRVREAEARQAASQTAPRPPTKARQEIHRRG